MARAGIFLGEDLMPNTYTRARPFAKVPGQYACTVTSQAKRMVLAATVFDNPGGAGYGWLSKFETARVRSGGTGRVGAIVCFTSRNTIAAQQCRIAE